MRNVSDGRPQHVVGENRESRVLANDWPIRTLRAETIENKTARFSARRLAVCLTSVTRVPAARKSDYAGASGRIGVSLLGSPPARAVRTMHRERLRRFPLDHGNRLIAVGADETGCSSDRFSHRRPTPVAWRRDDQPTNGAPLSAPNCGSFDYRLLCADWRRRSLNIAAPIPPPSSSIEAGSGTGAVSGVTFTNAE
jgi:hypothetical protein